MKTFFLRLLPYTIAFIIGIIMYVVTVIHIKDANLNGLMMNIAAGLLSVPLVFICYEIVKEYCDKTVNESISEHLYFELNHSIISILTCTAQLLGVKKISSEELTQYNQMNKSALKKMLQNFPTLADDFNAAKSLIDNIIHGSKHIDILPNNDIYTILNISKQTGIIARELKFNTSQETKTQLTNSVSALLTYITQWAESQEENFSQHHSFTLLENDAP